MKLVFIVVLTLMMINTQENQFKFVGDWKGELNVEAQGLKYPLVFKIRQVEDKLTATLDSPEQGPSAMGLKFDEVIVAGDKITLKMSQILGEYEAEMKEGKLVGKWRQGGIELDLTLQKEKKIGKS